MNIPKSTWILAVYSAMLLPDLVGQASKPAQPASAGTQPAAQGDSTVGDPITVWLHFEDDGVKTSGCPDGDKLDEQCCSAGQIDSDIGDISGPGFDVAGRSKFRIRSGQHRAQFDSREFIVREQRQ
jgi:hypothetical protein